MIKLYNFDELRPEEILNRDIRAEKNVEDVVDGIIADVRARGDDALKDYARKRTWRMWWTASLPMCAPGATMP